MLCSISAYNCYFSIKIKSRKNIWFPSEVWHKFVLQIATYKSFTSFPQFQWLYSKHITLWQEVMICKKMQQKQTKLKIPWTGNNKGKTTIQKKWSLIPLPRNLFYIKLNHWRSNLVKHISWICAGTTMSPALRNGPNLHGETGRA